MRYLSVCSGIEAATVAWHPLGWVPVALSEIDAFPSAVLAHHYPTVPNWGDMTQFKEWPDAAIDVLVGGTPCQSFSVAGLRKGLSDPRGNLALTFLAIVDRYRPRWVVYENVPGILSADSHDAPDPCPPPPPLDLGCDGAEVDTEDEYDADEAHAFACLLAGFSELGYFGAYGTLDAQYAGLAQRRKRVFAVFHLGSWNRGAAVLFDRSSLSGHPAPRREAGTGVADFAISRALTSSHTATGRLDPNESTFIPVAAFDARQSDVIQYGDQAGPLDTDGHSIAVAFQTRGSNIDVGDVSGTFGSNADRASGSAPMVARSMAVRRLTPKECERLQGFPDDYTLIPYRGKLAADGPRYKALGNSMAVPVMRWIGRRIQMVEEI